MKAGLSAELLLVLRVDARNRSPVSTATSLLTLVEESQASSFPVLLQGLPTQFLEEARDDARFAMVVSAHEPGSMALDHINIMDVIFEVRVPDCTGVFKLWTDQAFVCSFFDFQLTVPEGPTLQAQCSV